MAKRGTFNLGMRLEGGFALMAMIVSNLAGNKRSMSDFMPHAAPVDEDPDRLATPDDIKRMFKVRT